MLRRAQPASKLTVLVANSTPIVAVGLAGGCFQLFPSRVGSKIFSWQRSGWRALGKVPLMYRDLAGSGCCAKAFLGGRSRDQVPSPQQNMGLTHSGILKHWRLRRKQGSCRKTRAARQQVPACRDGHNPPETDTARRPGLKIRSRAVLVGTVMKQKAQSLNPCTAGRLHQWVHTWDVRVSAPQEPSGLSDHVIGTPGIRLLVGYIKRVGNSCASHDACY